MADDTPGRAPLPDDATPEQARAYVLEDYDRYEKVAADILADPGPMVQDGQIVRDSDGRPIPNGDVIRKAERFLALVRRDRAEMMGDGPAISIN